MKFEDLSGKRFNSLTVIERVQNADYSQSPRWKCKCDCGNETTAFSFQLKNGAKKSCGCSIGKAYHKKAVTTHGDRYKRLYRIWTNMKQRTSNPNHTAYKNYGGRGITVCDEWKNSYEAFREWALNNGYNDELTIDRINVNDGYSPNNCRWATKEEQNRNMRSNVIIEYNGERKTMAEWAKSIGITEQALFRRIKVLNWTLEEALNVKAKLFVIDVVKKIAEEQRNGDFATCPRCGYKTMSERLTHNALSRRADIYICDTCGTEEALCDFAGTDDAVEYWYVIRRNLRCNERNA